MKGLRFLTAFLIFLATCAPLSASPAKTKTIKAKHARSHVGETARVCGQVDSTHFAFKTRGQPTFLNFGRPYPHQIFTAVIWGVNRARFGNAEKRYLDKRICVTGLITVYRGQPEMTLKDPKQVEAK